MMIGALRRTAASIFVTGQVSLPQRFVQDVLSISSVEKPPHATRAGSIQMCWAARQTFRARVGWGRMCEKSPPRLPSLAWNAWVRIGMRVWAGRMCPRLFWGRLETEFRSNSRPCRRPRGPYLVSQILRTFSDSMHPSQGLELPPKCETF
jgi:hypothetical protein